MKGLIEDLLPEISSDTIIMSIITILVGVCPLIFNYVVIDRKYKWLYVVRTVYEEYLFYLKLLILSLFQCVVGVFILIVPYAIIAIFSEKIASSICSIVAVLYIWLGANKIRNLGWVRQELLGRKEDVYIYIPTILVNIVIIMFYNRVEENVYTIFLCVTYIFFEAYSILKVYRGRYEMFPYSKAEIILDNQEKIVCNDIKKMRRKRDVLIIENGKSEERICCNHILYIKYDGELVVKRMR